MFWLAPYYKDIYLFIVTVCSLVYYNRYRNGQNVKIVDSSTSAFFLAIMMAFFIGLRPIHDVFADTIGIAAYYQAVSNELFTFSLECENLIFDNLLAWMSYKDFDVSIFLLVCSLTYFLCRWWSCKKLFPRNTMIAFLMFLGAFITYTSSVNGFKAGAAASLFCCAIACEEDLSKNWWRAVIFLALSYGVHHAMHVCIAAYILCLLYKNSKIYFALWTFALLCAIFHISYFQFLFAGFTDEKGAGYLMADRDTAYLTGMRYDFVIYSAMPVLMGWFIIFKKKLDIPGYRFVLNLYLLLNSMWLLCMYASFTNRIAALSWFMYSLVLCYPFLRCENVFNNDNYRIIAKVMIYQLVFTLFMEIIYYSLLH